MDKLDRFFERADVLLDRLDGMLVNPSATNLPDWDAACAFRWEHGELQAVIHPHRIAMADLPHIIELVSGRGERYILYCDDLSFNANESGYQSLKAVLDGSLVAFSDNLLIYATSNRRHLMPEFMQDNLATEHIGDEIHPAENLEEKISLSERFGLWISFYPFSQDVYLSIVAHWLYCFGCADGINDVVCRAALQWATQRGTRSGRVALQFSRDWAGKS